MDIQILTVWIRNHWEQLKAGARGDAGQSSSELAVITGALLLAAAALVIAIKTKLMEKIGIINGA